MSDEDLYQDDALPEGLPDEGIQAEEPATENLKGPFFPDRQQVIDLTAQFGNALYVYDEASLRRAAREVLACQAPFGTTVRYAMKANPLREILRTFDQEGLHIDASSGNEAFRAMAAGIDGSKILLTTQEIPPTDEFMELLDKGIQFNASSLAQLEAYGRLPRRPNKVSIRINPGTGSGGHAGTTVGGSKSGFGIWHEDIPEIQRILKQYDLKVDRVHTHIGSGSNPDVWREVTRQSIALLEHFPTASILDLGGGFKEARMPNENRFDFQGFHPELNTLINDFHAQTGRTIHIEFEPGTRLVANSGAIIAKVQDTTRTPNAFFAKLNIGMTEILRPAMYEAIHPFQIHHTVDETYPIENTWVVGHCCESSDTLTPEPIELSQAQIGDWVVVGGAGAYCESMNTGGYNSFTRPPSVLIRENGSFQLIRRAQRREDLWRDEA